MTLKKKFKPIGCNSGHTTTMTGLRKPLQIPLISESKDGKLYFRTLSSKSYYIRQECLNISLSEKGQRLVSRYENKIDDIWNSDGNLSYDKKKRIMYQYKSEVSKVYNNRHYQVLSIGIRALLEYALCESSYKEFDKSIENLAECDKYHEIKDGIYSYNEFGETKYLQPDHYFRYFTKKNFPFLSHYSELRRVLPLNFMAKTLKNIAKQLRGDPEVITASFEGLKYKITEHFFNRINTLFENNDNKIDQHRNKIVEEYLSEIGVYVAHTNKRELINRKNIEMFENIKQRHNKLTRNLYEIMENTKKDDSKQIIPIYKSITKSRLPWSYVSNVLTSIENDYGTKFIVTDRCFISRSKARELKLKSLLHGHPSFEKACLSLISKGIPKECISEKLFYKLGFSTAFENRNYNMLIVVPNVRK
jgi:Txe/YoeB family toxin of Txe-Axe toxin-antitoxin module